MPITAALPIDAVLAVANSYHEPETRDVGSTDGAHWIPAHDHLDSAETAIEFLSRMGIRLTGRPNAGQLERLRRVRAAARALLGRHASYHRQLAHLLADAVYRLDADGRLHSGGCLLYTSDAADE